MSDLLSTYVIVVSIRSGVQSRTFYVMYDESNSPVGADMITTELPRAARFNADDVQRVAEAWRHVESVVIW